MGLTFLFIFTGLTGLAPNGPLTAAALTAPYPNRTTRPSASGAALRGLFSKLDRGLRAQRACHFVARICGTSSVKPWLQYSTSLRE